MEPDRRTAPTGRLLIVASNFPPVRGGSAVVYDSLARCAGGRIQVLAPSRDWRSGEELPGWHEFDAAAPYRVWRRPYVRAPAVSKRSWLERKLRLGDLRHFAALFWQIGGLCRREDIDTICIGELVSGGWLVLPCRLLLGKTVVIYVHGEEIAVRSGVSLSERLKDRFLRTAHYVVAVSGFTRERLLSHGIRPDRILLNPNGVDAARFGRKPSGAGPRERLALGDRPIILTVARLVERKGIDTVIQALPLIRAAVPRIHYLIVGEGPYRPVLERMVRDRGLGGCVTFLGDVPDVELVTCYHAADLFVMPNRTLPDGDTEGFGLVFLEANAAGLPVIGGASGGVPDAVIDGWNGILVDGTDPRQTAAATVRVLSDRSLYDRLREGAVAAAANADWRTRTAQLLAIGRTTGAEPNR